MVLASSRLRSRCLPARHYPAPYTPLTAALVVLFGWPLAYTLTPILVLFWGQFVPIVVALYSVARYGDARQRLLGAVAGAATLLFFDLRVPELGDPSEIVFHWMVSAVAFGLGFFVHSFERRAITEAERAVRAESTSREQALQAVSDERARIARELHDIVAHSMSVMVVQAGAAEKALDDTRTTYGRHWGRSAPPAPARSPRCAAWSR